MRFRDIFFAWTVPSPKEIDLEGAHAIIALSFSLRRSGAGVSNDALAREVRTLKSITGLPVIHQVEVSQSEFFPRGIVIDEYPSGEIKNTHEVLAEAASICARHGWRNIIVIAHPLHLWRCVMVAKKLGLHPIGIPDLAIPFDPESVQWWGWSRSLFVLREIPARLLFWWRGYL